MSDNPYAGKVLNQGQQKIKGNVKNTGKGKDTIHTGGDLRSGKPKG